MKRERRCCDRTKNDCRCVCAALSRPVQAEEGRSHAPSAGHRRVKSGGGFSQRLGKMQVGSFRFVLWLCFFL